MRIYKHKYGYSVSIDDNVSIHFDEFQKSRCGVELFSRDHYVGKLHFEAATEFYKAWRAM